MRRIVLAFLAVVAVVALGCVNIPKKLEAHIVIDIRHQITDQANSVLDYVEGKTDALEDEAGESAPPGEGASLRRLYEFVAPVRPVYAAELRTVSPEIETIAASLRERNDKVQELKERRVAGENNRGYLELRDADDLKPEERNEAQRTVAAERKDRKALYQEIARLNKDQDVTVSMVEQIYAFERLKRAEPGEIFELPAKGELFEKLRTMPLGKKLGDECQPGAWVTIK